MDIMKNPVFEIKMFPASYGDAFLVSFFSCGKKNNILIDGGFGKTAKKIKKVLGEKFRNGEIIDLLIITHIDNDHLLGIKNLIKNRFLSKSNVGEVWFNARASFNENKINFKNHKIFQPKDKSVKEAIILEKYLKKYEFNWKNKEIIASIESVLLNGCKITILSPNNMALMELKDNFQTSILEPIDKSVITDYEEHVNDLIQKPFNEDESIANRSSIAFIAEYKGRRLLMLGDAVPSILEDTLSKLPKFKYDLVKISHHGSKCNTNENLLKFIKTDLFLISTNGLKFSHPDKECLARIVKFYHEEITFGYNYQNIFDSNIFSTEEKLKYKIKEEVITQTIKIW